MTVQLSLGQQRMPLGDSFFRDPHSSKQTAVLLQESGRAGRDGKAASCILLFTKVRPSGEEMLVQRAHVHVLRFREIPNVFKHILSCFEIPLEKAARFYLPLCSCNGRGAFPCTELFKTLPHVHKCTESVLQSQ